MRFAFALIGATLLLTACGRGGPEPILYETQPGQAAPVLVEPGSM